MARANGSPAKRVKRRDPLATIKRNPQIAERFVVYSISGVTRGVKHLGKECIVNAQEAFLLTNVKHRFAITVGAVGRDKDGKVFLEMEHCITEERVYGDDIIEDVRDIAQDCADVIGKDNALTTFFFATPKLDYEFSDIEIIRYLEDAGTMDKLITFREHTINRFIDVRDALNEMKNKPAITVADTLLKIRTGCGVTNKKMAEVMGLLPSDVANFICGRRNPNAQVLTQLHHWACKEFDPNYPPIQDLLTLIPLAQLRVSQRTLTKQQQAVLSKLVSKPMSADALARIILLIEEEQNGK